MLRPLGGGGRQLWQAVRAGCFGARLASVEACLGEIGVIAGDGLADVHRVREHAERERCRRLVKHLRERRGGRRRAGRLRFEQPTALTHACGHRTDEGDELVEVYRAVLVGIAFAQDGPCMLSGEAELLEREGELTGFDRAGTVRVEGIEAGL